MVGHNLNDDSGGNFPALNIFEFTDWGTYGTVTHEAYELKSEVNCLKEDHHSWRYIV